LAFHGIINVVAGAGPARPSTKYKNINNLSIIIGSYRSTVTKQINKLNNNSLKWQRSFHGEIIRTGNHSLYDTREYIINNPANWEMDENNIKNYSIKGGIFLNNIERILSYVLQRKDLKPPYKRYNIGI